MSMDEETDKALKQIAKIRPEEWTKLAHTATALKEFVQLGGASTLFGKFGQTIKDTLKAEIDNLTAPLLNAINAGINTALAPIMPVLEDIINTTTTIIGRGFNLLTGNFAALRRELIAFQKEREANYINQGLDYHEKLAYEAKYGVDLDVLSAQGTAGGVYSGQFDVDADAIAKLLKDFNLGGF